MAIADDQRHGEELHASPIPAAYPRRCTPDAFSGSSGNRSLESGFRAYRLFSELAGTYAAGITAESTVLDFGCGWGRILRFWLKDIAPANLWGIDCYPEVLNYCKASNKWSNFALTDVFPPTPFAGDTFDLVYCYSVFSHLAEDIHRQWLQEFQRILKPGGLLIATTYYRDWILNADNYIQRKWPEFMRPPDVKLFPDVAKALDDYDNGRYCHTSFRGGGPLDSSIWGETCIPEAYVRGQWSDLFEVLEFIDDRAGQNVIVVRK